MPEKNTFLRNSPFLASILLPDCYSPKKVLSIPSTYMWPQSTRQGLCKSKPFPWVKTNILSVEPAPCTPHQPAHTQLSKWTAASTFQGKLPEGKLRYRAAPAPPPPLVTSDPLHQSHKRKQYLWYCFYQDWSEEEKGCSLAAVSWCLWIVTVAPLSRVRQGQLPPSLTGPS